MIKNQGLKCAITKAETWIQKTALQFCLVWRLEELF